MREMTERWFVLKCREATYTNDIELLVTQVTEVSQVVSSLP